MRKLIILVLLAAIAAGVYHFFIGQKAGGAAGMPGMGGPVPVDIAAVEQREVVAWDEFSGRLEAVDRVEIRPRVAGTIDAIHFEEGQKVEQGQLLFTIDPKPFEAAVQAAKARASFAQAELARARGLLPAKVISQSQFDDKRNASEVANAELTKAQLDLGYAQIKAPVAGRINRSEITVGNLVSAGGQAPLLTTIVSLDPIYANVEIDEQSFVRYLQAHNGNSDALKDIPVQLALAGQEGFPYQGHIKSFDNELDTRAGTVRMRAIFDNKDSALIPGLYAKLRIGGSGEQKLLLISEDAIGTDQNKKFVFVVGADKKVEYRVVTLGPLVEGKRVIRDGLKLGEKIVVGGLQRVRPGVEVVQQAPAAAPADAGQAKK